MYYGVEISNKDWRVKTLRGNEFGEIHSEASSCFAVVPLYQKLAVEV
jgi:hypothetical protein